MQRDKKSLSLPWRRGLVTDIMIHLVIELTVVSCIDHLLRNTAASLALGILPVEGTQHLLNSRGETG
jgi:hypothetical protein